MATKIRIFEARMRIKKMEDDVNEFIGKRDAQSIQVSYSVNGIVIMVVHNE